MKKFFIPIIIVIFIIIISYLFFFTPIFVNIYNDIRFKDTYYSREIYTNNSTYNYSDKSFSKNSLNKNGININFSNFNYHKENNSIELNFDFSKENADILNNIGFILRIYDDEKTLTHQISNGYILKFPESHMYSKYYLKEQYNDYIEEYGLFSNSNLVTFTNYSPEDNSYITKKITLTLPENYNIKGNLNISLLDLQYQTTKSPDYNKVISPLGEFLFTVNFK